MNAISEKHQIEEIHRLKKMNETKAKVFAIVAHNIVAPLKYMSGMTDFSIQNWDSMSRDELKDCATIMRDSSNSLSELSLAVMEWSRFQMGMDNNAVQSINLYDLFEEERKFFKNQLEEKNIEFVNQVPRSITCEGQYAMVRLIFQNIISNAIKFSYSGQSVTVEAAEFTDRLEISVADLGIGMTNGELEKIFDSSDRIVNKGTDNEKGFGIGLLIARDLIFMNKAELQIQSKPDLGTRMTVVFNKES